MDTSNPFNRPEPMELIDLETEHLTGYSTRSPSNLKTDIKKFGFYTLLVIIPLIVTIATTSVRINQELQQIKIDFAAEMNKLNQDLNEFKILGNGSYYEYYSMNSSDRIFFVAKAKEKMNFTEGQRACEMINGFMFEFDKTNKDTDNSTKDIQSDFKSLAQIFGVDQFYTNILKEEGDIWTNLTIPDTLWNEGEPNNSNSENCVLVHKEDVGDDGEIYGLNNIDCSTKSNIICMKNKK